MKEFLEMGGYAVYVWPAYLISAAVLISIAAAIWSKSRSLGRKMKELGADAARER